MVSVGAAHPNVTRQRIAIEERFDSVTHTGAWRVIPLTSGPITRDSGKLTLSGHVAGSAMRNGAKVTLIVGRHNLAGKHGTFTVSHRVESADVQLGTGYSADIGTWKLTAGTAAFAGFKGGGRFAAVGLPSGVIFAHQEGWVTR
jgi:hypothetical protein